MSESKKRRRGHGEGTIFQRKQDGRWVVRLPIPGRKQPITRYAKTRKEAAELLKALQRAVDQGLSPDSSRQTVQEYLDRWLSASVQPSVRPKTYSTYETLCRTRIVPRIGKKRLNAISPLDIQELYAQLASDSLSPRTVLHVHRVLHGALNQAVSWQLIPRNPCKGVKPPRVPKSERRVWTPMEAQTFLRSTQHDRSHALYVLALTSGMRQGELLGLCWSDIDWDNRTLAVRRALQPQRGNGLVFTEPKTNRSRRVIELSQTAIAALRDHQDQQAVERESAGPTWHESDLVFCTPTGTPLSPTNETKRFQRIATSAGLPKISFHDLRHTAATILLARNVHPKMVSEMLGHSSVVLTLDRYSHVIPTMHADAAAAMDAAFAT